MPETERKGFETETRLAENRRWKPLGRQARGRISQHRRRRHGNPGVWKLDGRVWRTEKVSGPVRVDEDGCFARTCSPAVTRIYCLTEI